MHQKRNKRLSWIVLGHLSMLFMVFLSIFYFKERTLFADPAYMLFDLMNHDTVLIAADRYTDYIIMFPAWLANEAGGSIAVVLATFSITTALWFYALFVVVVHGLKNHLAGIAMVLALVLGVRLSFYHSISEAHQVMVYACVLWAWLYHPLHYSGMKNTLIRALVGLLLFVLAFYAHPVAVVIFGIVLGYWTISENKWNAWLPYLIAAGILLVVFMKMKLTTVTGYEQFHFGNMNNVFTKVPNIFETHHWDVFTANFKGWSFFSFLLIGLTLIAMGIRRQWLGIGLFLVALYGLFWFMAAMFPLNNGVLMEKDLLPWIFLVIVVFVGEVLAKPLPTSNLNKTIAVAIVVIACLHQVFLTGKFFSKRLNYMNQLIDVAAEYDTQKLYVPLDMADAYRIDCVWSYPYESFMLSIMEEKPPTTIFVSKFRDQFNPNDTIIFLGAPFSKVGKVQHLHHPAFVLPDDEPYVLLDRKIEYQSD